MFVKYNFEGKSMIKYFIAALVIKIILVVFFIASIIPNGKEIIAHIDGAINTDQLFSTLFLLKQLGWIAVKLIITIAIESAIAFGIIIPLAKKAIDDIVNGDPFNRRIRF